MRVALDSNIFIYALAQASEWREPALAVLRQVEAGEMSGVASVLCFSEVLPYPFMKSPAVGEGAQLFMEGIEGLDFAPVGAEIAIRAGRLRGQYGSKLETPDAIHLASAIYEKADYFVTNDHALLKLKLGGIAVHLLGEPLPMGKPA